MSELPFVWPVNLSGDRLSGSIVYDKTPILSTNMYPNYVIDIVKKIMNNETIPRFRIAVLNPDETIKYYIPSSDIMQGGSYQENYQTVGQRRSLSFSLLNNDNKYTPSIYNMWEGTKVAFEAGMYSHLYEATVYFRKGIFVVQSVSVSRNNGSNTVQFSCGDKYSIFEDNHGTIMDSYEIEYGIDIKDIITDTITQQLGNGAPLDPKPIVYSLNFIGRTTQQKVSANAGSKQSELLNNLATMLSSEMFYNADGNLTFIPITEIVQDDSKPLIAEYVDYDGTVLGNSFSFDYKNIVNYIKVIGGTVNGHTCTAVASNDDPNSPINISRIGYHYASPISDGNITSDINAQERADYELRLKTIFNTSFSIPVMYNPILTVNNLISYSDVFFQMQKERFLIEGIQFSLDYSGQMTLNISNIKNLPFCVPKRP